MAQEQSAEFSIIPVGERLVVRRITQQQQGRVLLTEGSKDLGTEAEIVAMGLGVTKPLVYANASQRQVDPKLFELANLQIGARIFISRFVGVPIDIDGTEDSQLVIIKAEDVLGIKAVRNEIHDALVNAVKDWS